MLASGGYGCVFSPAIDCDGTMLESKKYVSKLQVYNKYAKREIKIGKLVTSIRGYLNHFVPIVKHCEVKIGEIEDKEKEKCEIFKKKDSKQFTTMKMPFINGIDFIDFITKHKDDNMIISNIISSYNHLLIALDKLISKNILHFDLKGTNILFDYDLKLPLIIDFGLSAVIKKNITDEQVKEIFYIFGPEYYVWPLEVHYLSFLINEKLEPDEDDLSMIVDEYVSNNKALVKNFSNGFLEKFKKKCQNQLKYYESLKTFSNKKDLIIQYWKTFDNYSLSIMYLKFINLMNINGYTDNKFIVYFSELLLTNIDPDPRNRLTIVDTIQKFNGFLNKDINEGIEMFKDFKKKFISNKSDIVKELSYDKKSIKLQTLQIRKSLS